MVEFVSYDGKWPNLCGGLLVLKIDNKLYAFCQFSKKASDTNMYGVWNNRSCIRNNPDIIKIYEFALISGGSTDYDASGDDRIKQGNWSVGFRCSYLDNGEKFLCSKELEQEITDCINENIEHGCCGGCI